MSETPHSKILVELQDHMGSDEAIANAAWTSSYNLLSRKEIIERGNHDRIADLVRRLAREGHAVPFESVVFRFWIRMPIFTDRQHMTHRIASHNGLSGRYRTMPDDWYPMPDEVRDIFKRASPMTEEVAYLEAAFLYNASCVQSYRTYETLLSSLRAGRGLGKITEAEYKRGREVARGVLPLAGMVERTTVLNLRSFANYQRQRNSPHAQPEIRQVAELMLQEVEKANVCPVALAALIEAGWRL